MNGIAAEGTTPSPSPDDAAIAFDAMRRQLALLASAVEGFASHQEVVAARDYAPDLEKIARRIARVNENIVILSERPGVALKPVDIAEQIEAAGKSVREADHAALCDAHRTQSQATQNLDGLINRVRTRAEQTDALIWAAMVGIVAAMLLILLGNVALERLGWLPSAETRAMALLGGDRWKAGQVLMAAEDPVRWRDMVKAVRLADANAEALARCGHEGKTVRCSIEVPAEPARRAFKDSSQQ